MTGVVCVTIGVRNVTVAFVTMVLIVIAGVAVMAVATVAHALDRSRRLVVPEMVGGAVFAGGAAIAP